MLDEMLGAFAPALNKALIRGFSIVLRQRSANFFWTLLLKPDEQMVTGKFNLRFRVNKNQRKKNVKNHFGLLNDLEKC